MLTAQDVAAARDRIAPHVVLTGCPQSFAIGEAVGCRVQLKAELRQRTGSFKDRGSLNKLLLLSREQRDAGVVAASAGNHAQALARHAARLGIPCTIVMPDTAPLIKVSNTRASGAKVIQTGETLSDGMVVVERLIDEEGLTLVHAFDDLAVMAGQGTMGLEILEQVPDVDTIVVPVGGGGMISGIATAVKARKPDVRVVGVEAAASPGAVRSLEAGAPTHVELSDTLADGIAVKQIGDLTYPHIEAHRGALLPSRRTTSSWSTRRRSSAPSSSFSSARSWWSRVRARSAWPRFWKAGSGCGRARPLHACSPAATST